MASPCQPVDGPDRIAQRRQLRDLTYERCFDALYVCARSARVGASAQIETRSTQRTMQGSNP